MCLSLYCVTFFRSLQKSIEGLPILTLRVPFGRFLLKKYGIHTLIHTSPILHVTFGLYLEIVQNIYLCLYWVSLLVAFC